MRLLALIAVIPMLAACRTIQTPAAHTQAEQIYETLRTTGADRDVEGAVIRTQSALDESRRALAAKEPQEYVDGVAHIALRTAQVAEAAHARHRALRAADSLNTARLNRQIQISEAERRRLEQQGVASRAQISDLERDRLRTQQTADSLRREAERANQQLEAALGQLRSLVAEITNLRETTRGLVISLSDILFDVNRATLRAGAEANVRRIAAVLQQYPDREIVVEGHTDATGGAAYNQKLSEERAAAVRTALVSGGVPADQITSRGFGLTQPVATNETAAGRQQNRRVEIVVLGAGSLADIAPPAPAQAPPSTPPPARR
jgi:OmpA-OmpF porin, OOP family